MTLKELLEVCPSCVFIEATVRENGNSNWIHQYRVGLGAYLNQYEAQTAKIPMYLEERERVYIGRLHKAKMPLTVVNDDLRHIPNEILNLKVCNFFPRSLDIKIRRYQGSKGSYSDNRFALEINLYPEGYMFEDPEADKDQITFDEILSDGESI